MTAPVIVCQYSDGAGQWYAWFDGSQSVAYGADLPMRAVCRLLEGSGVDPCAVMLHVSQDQVGSGVLIRDTMWKPPELLFMCSQCHGTGECVGLVDREKCQACYERGWLVG